MRLRLTLSAVALAAVAAVVALRPSPEQPPAPSQPRTLTLEAQIAGSTLLAFTHTGPPPWPAGNGFSLSTDRRRQDAPRYHVVNMHAENFRAVVKLLGLDAVEVLVFDEKWCLVTDTRISREWLLEAPRDGTRSAVWERLKESHADKFRGG